MTFLERVRMNREMQQERINAIKDILAVASSIVLVFLLFIFMLLLCG